MTEPTSKFRENFKACIEDIQQLSNREKWSEADTITKVIIDIITCLGYKKDDYLQESAVLKGRADFALLENTNHMWFIEVKQWSTSLHDNDIVQALNYANTLGLKYAVLTNGQEWRVYDNSIQKGASEKQLFSIHIFDPTAIDQLWFLSKESMVSGALDLHKNEQILKKRLENELTRSDSKMIRQIVRMLKSDFNLTTDGQAVIRAIGDMRQAANAGQSQSMPAISQVPPLLQYPTGTGQSQCTPAISQVPQSPVLINFANESKVGGVQTNTINELTTLGVAHSKPISLTVGGNVVSVKMWSEVLDSVIGFLYKEQKLPQLPFKPIPGGAPYFLEVANGPRTIKNPKSVPGSNGELIYQPDLQARSMITFANALWEQSGFPAKDIVVRWHPKYYSQRPDLIKSN